MKAVLCPVCQGCGRYLKKICHGCNGKGWVMIPGSQSPLLDWKPFEPYSNTTAKYNT